MKKFLSCNSFVVINILIVVRLTGLEEFTAVLFAYCVLYDRHSVFCMIDILHVFLQQGKKTEITTKISQVRNGVTDFTAHIEAMRSTRDLKLADIERLQKELQVCYSLETNNIPCFFSVKIYIVSGQALHRNLPNFLMHYILPFPSPSQYCLKYYPWT